MKKRVHTRLIVFCGAVVVCLALVYFLPRLGANKPPSPATDRAITKPIAKPSAKEAHRTVQPQGKASGAAAPGLLAQAEAALADANIRTRVKAANSLRREMSAEAVALLAKYLNDPEVSVLQSAIDSLGVIGFETENLVLKKLVLDVLLEKAKEKTFSFRGPALYTAAMLGEDERTFQLIGEYIAEDGDEGKDSAVRALSFLQSPKIVPYLFEIMDKTKDPEILRNASALLAKIGTPEAVARLSQKLNSRREDDQVNSAWALSLKNDYASNALLIDAVSSNKLSESAIAAIAVSSAAPSVFGGALELNISKEDKLYLLDMISKYTSDASGSVRNEMAEAIKPMIKSEDRDLKLAAIEALGKVGAKTDQSSTLAEEFNSPDFMIRGAALEAFIPYCTQGSYKELKKLWFDEDEKTRRTAFYLSMPFVNKSDLEDLTKAASSGDQLIAKSSKKVINNLSEGVL